MQEHPVDVGHRSEVAILHHLTQRGYQVLLPSGVNQRYDLVIDAGDRFIRAQCKTGRLRDGAVVFNTCSVRSNTRGTRSRAYDGEADVFLVYCADSEHVYVVPIADAPRRDMRLRVRPAANGQTKKVRWAREFELDGSAALLAAPRLGPVRRSSSAG